MRIDINLPPGQRQRQFLDHFNSTLRSISSASSGSAGFEADGTFRAETNSVFALPSGEMPLTWSVVRSPQAELLAIEVEPSGREVPAPSWSADAQSLVTKALAATLADRQQLFFQRSLFNYVGPALDGEYWLRGFRFGPLLPNDEHPTVVNAERLVVIDMDVNAVDQHHAASIARERALRHTARLSLLANIPLYNTLPELRWGASHTDSGIGESQRFQLGYFGPAYNVIAMPEKSALCRPGKFGGPLGQRYPTAGNGLMLPEETRKILRAVDDAPLEIVEAFDRCARLFQVALVCGRIYPSVGLAYRVAAVEAVVQTTGQFGSFSEFMQSYVAPRPNLKTIVDYLYSRVRSAHFHAGEFPAGEFERFFALDPLMDADFVMRSDLQRECYDVLREGIVRWIIALIPPLSEADD
jgi:hypothetical protein